MSKITIKWQGEGEGEMKSREFEYTDGFPIYQNLTCLLDAIDNNFKEWIEEPFG